MKRSILLILACTLQAEGQKLRWGILSTAQISHTFVQAFKGSTHSEVTAVASRSLEKAEAYATQYSIPTAYGSYEELISDPNIDVVYIPLPNNLHAEWAIKAAQQKKHVLCEKPIALSIDELDQIQQAAQENNVVIFEGLMYLHHPQTLVVEEIIRKGIIGDIIHIKAWLERYMPADTDAICLHPEFGGGSLWNFGIYPVSFAMLIASQIPTSVHANQKKNEFGCDDVFVGQLKFDTCSAHISCNMISPSSKGATIVGTKGRIEIPNPWTPGKQNEDTEITVVTHEYGSETLTIGAKNPYLCEIQDMELCVLENKSPRIPLNISKAFLYSILALYDDAQQH
jgi:predicted dehydrogenase